MMENNDIKSRLNNIEENILEMHEYLDDLLKQKDEMNELFDAFKKKHENLFAKKEVISNGN